MCRLCDSKRAIKQQRENPYSRLSARIRKSIADKSATDRHLWDPQVVQTIMECFDHKSIISGECDNLALARWSEAQGWHPHNVVVCTANEAKRLVGLRHREGSICSALKDLCHAQSCMQQVKSRVFDDTASTSLKTCQTRLDY